MLKILIFGQGTVLSKHTYRINILATVSVRLEEDGNIATGLSADTDTVVASARAHIHALNRLKVRRDKTGAGGDVREISYTDPS